MAGSMSDYLENEILDHTLGVGSWSSPATIYLACYTSDPTDADTGTEATGGGYARQAMAFNTASAGSTDNNAVVAFAAASATLGTLSHWGLCDAVTGGNLLWHGDFDTAKHIGSGDQAKVNTSDIGISQD